MLTQIESSYIVEGQEDFSSPNKATPMASSTPETIYARIVAHRECAFILPRVVLGADARSLYSICRLNLIRGKSAEIIIAPLSV